MTSYSISTAFSTRTIGGANNTVVTTATDYQTTTLGVTITSVSTEEGETVTSVETTTVPGKFCSFLSIDLQHEWIGRFELPSLRELERCTGAERCPVLFVVCWLSDLA